MKLLHSWFVLTILHIKYTIVTGKILHVSDFGAYPNDNIDDTKAVQLTVNAAISYGLQTTISFGAGTYNLSSTITLMNATNLTITGQGIGQTLLVGDSIMSIFFAQYCTGLTITSLSIDFDPLPFTAGYVVNVTSTHLDVQIQPPHRPDVNRTVQGISRYDPIELRPAFGSETYNFYQVPPSDANTTLVSTNVLRIPLAGPTEFRAGDAIVAVYDIFHHCLVVQDSSDFLVKSINIHSSWGFVMFTIRVKRITITDYHVTPLDGRWFSGNSDCMHLISTVEYLHLSDSKCQNQGDDGLNVLAHLSTVTEVINSTAVIISAFNFTDSLDIEDGTRLEFSSKTQPFTPLSIGTVASSVLYTSTSRLFIFTNPINASIGDYVCVTDTPSVTIRNFTVEHNRARALLLEARNADIRNCVFNKTSGPAVFFQPSMFWYEGPPGRNITLSNNLYINCNEGIGREQGLITVLPDPVQTVPVIEDIRIESSTFYFGNFSRGLLQANNANNIHMTGNYIATNSSIPLINICNSRNITASNNTVYNTQSKIDQYYTFDETNPCQKNLSSLIDLPPSAFNSSFSPPVILFDAITQNNEH